MKFNVFLRLFILALIGLAGVLGATARLSAQDASPAVTSPTTEETFEIFGLVANPGPVMITDLQALPAETVEVNYRTEAGVDEQHAYTGALLWDVLQLAQPAIDPVHKDSSLRLYLVFTAKDGYIVVLSVGEIDPEFGAQPYLLAWEEDGQPFTGDRSPAMLVVPGDKADGRFIHGIASIEVRSVDPTASS